METRIYKAICPNTDQEYDVEFQVGEVVRQAILDLKYPEEGLRVKDAVETLSDKFGLSNEKKIAVNKSKLNIFRYSVVAPQFRNLLDKGQLVQPEGSKTPYFLPGDDDFVDDKKVFPIETTTRNAVDSAGKKFKIHLPTTKVIKEALLNFEYPSEGIRNMDVADALAVQFNLDEKTVNARHRNGYGLYLNHVNTAIRGLIKSGKLMKIRHGWIINPDQPEEITHDDRPDPRKEIASPIVVMERNYQEIQDNLERDLLEKIKEHSPDFFEELVLDLLVEMGYGGSRADAEAVGRIRDGGIDGIIKQDPLGLDIVYVQAKRWKNNVPDKHIRDFTGALAIKGAKKGIFITTSGFTKPSLDFARDLTTKKIILIDGTKLGQLMIKYNVGVLTDRTYDIKLIDDEYFGEIEE